MKKRSKILISLLLIVALCASMVMVMVACKPKKPVDPVEEWKAEFAEIIANSLDMGFKDGFNLDLGAKVNVASGDTNTDISLKIQGNILAPDKADKAGNNDFMIEIMANDEAVLGLYNKGNNLYATIGAGSEKQEYNFKNASISQALRYFLVQNVPGFEDFNLGKLNLGGLIGGSADEDMPLSDLIKSALPALLNKDIAPVFTKEGNVFIVEIDVRKVADMIVDLIGEGLGDFDINSILPETTTLKLKVEGQDKKIKNLDVALVLKDADMDTAVTVKIDTANPGFFGAVKNDYVVPVPETLQNAQVRSIIENKVAGTFNMMGKDKNGKDILIKTADWSLVAKVDLFQLVERNFQFSHDDFKDNFFHFQVSHKCTDTCKDYCKKLVSANGDATRYQNTSIIDLAWAPNSLGTPNIVADISLFDLVTNDALDKLVEAISGMYIPELGALAQPVLTGQLVVSLDTDKMMKPIDIKGLDDATTAAPALDLGGIDIMGIITGLFNTVGINGNGLNLSLDGLKGMIGGLLPGNLIGSVDAATLVNLLFDGNTVKNIAISGAEGPGTPLYTEGSTDFVKNYNTYEKAIRFNANGKDKMLQNEFKYTDYGAGSLEAGAKVTGNPALYTNKIYTADGYAELYTLDKGSGEYTLVVGKDAKISANDFKYTYANGKNLYIKYNYRGFNGLDADAYAPVYGFAGMDLNKAGDQNVTLLTGLMTGESFQYVLSKNLTGLLADFPGFAVDIPNIEGILPLAGGAVDCKINFIPATVKDMTFVKDNIKASDEQYNVNDWVNNEAKVSYKHNDVVREVTLWGTSDLKKDECGNMVPGIYTMTWTSPIDELKFAGDKSTVTKTFTVKAVTTKWIAPVRTEYIVGDMFTGNKNNVMDFGKVEYTYADETETLKVNLTYDMVSAVISSDFYERMKPFGGNDYALGFSKVGSTTVKTTILGQNHDININVRAQVSKSFGTKVMYYLAGGAELTLTKKAGQNPTENIIIQSLGKDGKTVLAESKHTARYLEPIVKEGIDKDGKTTYTITGYTAKILLTADQVKVGSAQFKLIADNGNNTTVFETTTPENTTVDEYGGNQETLKIDTITKVGAFFGIVLKEVEQGAFDKLAGLTVKSSLGRTANIENAELVYDATAKTVTFQVNQNSLGMLEKAGDISVIADANSFYFLDKSEESETAHVEADFIFKKPVIDSAVFKVAETRNILTITLSGSEFDQLATGDTVAVKIYFVYSGGSKIVSIAGKAVTLKGEGEDMKAEIKIDLGTNGISKAGTIQAEIQGITTNNIVKSPKSEIKDYAVQ